MNSNDLVSIIMPSYNCGNFVEETIRSIQLQTYQNWELLFVDDCSSDDTMDRVMAIREKDNRIHVYQNAVNSGAAVSRNLALRNAKGRWIAFLDSDDLWNPYKLEKQIHFMEDNGYSFTYTNVSVINENGQSLGYFWTGPKHISNHGMLRYDWIGCLTVMYDANKVGLVQIVNIAKNNDYAMWLKVIKKCDCYLLDDLLATYRIRKGSISNHNKLKLIKWHYILFRKAEDANPICAFLFTIRNLFYGFIKRILYKKALHS